MSSKSFSTIPLKASTEQELKTLYYAVLEMLLQGQYAPAADVLARMRGELPSQSEQREAVRRLIAIRLSIKKGDFDFDDSWLNVSVQRDSWIDAERSHVQGLIAFHRERYLES